MIPDRTIQVCDVRVRGIGMSGIEQSCSLSKSNGTPPLERVHECKNNVKIVLCLRQCKRLIMCLLLLYS